MRGGLRFHLVLLSRGLVRLAAARRGERRPIGWPRRPAALSVDLVPRCSARRSWPPPIGCAQPPLPHDAARLRAAAPPSATPSVTTTATTVAGGAPRRLDRSFWHGWASPRAPPALFGWPGRPRPPSPPSPPPASPVSSPPPASSSSRLCFPPAAHAGSRPQQSDRCLLCAPREHPPQAAPPPLNLPARVPRAAAGGGWLTRCVVRPPSPPAAHPRHNAAYGRGPRCNSLPVTASRERRCSYGHWLGW